LASAVEAVIGVKARGDGMLNSTYDVAVELAVDRWGQSHGMSEVRSALFQAGRRSQYRRALAALVGAKSGGAHGGSRGSGGNVEEAGEAGEAGEMGEMGEVGEVGGMIINDIDDGVHETEEGDERDEFREEEDLDAVGGFTEGPTRLRYIDDPGVETAEQLGARVREKVAANAVHSFFGYVCEHLYINVANIYTD
jgi:hypothetical protein